MAIFDVAQITEQGVDLILVPLHANFEFKSDHEKNDTITRLQSGASRAGLTGVVVPIWASRNGKMSCLIAERYHNLLRGIDLEFVANHINRTITINDRAWALLEA